MKYFNIILIIILVIIISYIFILHQNKNELITKITSEWHKQTNGSVKKDDHNHYYGDYYLSVNPLGNYDSHIHLITNNRSIIHFFNVFYMIKKNDIHSHIYIIDKNKSVNEIVSEMITNYYKFEI